MKWALATLVLILIFVGAAVFMTNYVWAPEKLEDVDSAEQSASTTNEVEMVVDEEFIQTLEEEVRVEVGPGVEGYSPDMLMEVFPGLTKEDFDGVKATMGEYAYEGEELLHRVGESELVNTATHAVTNEGLSQLLDNVLERTGINRELNRMGEIMEKLRQRSTLEVYDVDASDGLQWDTCSPESKLAEICTMEYAPVCGLVDVQCVTTPCPPVPETFSNACAACAQGNVSTYTEGECAL